MANTVNAVSFSHSPGGEDYATRFVITFSGSYVNGSGEPVNFNEAGNPNGIESVSAGDSVAREGVPDVLSSTLGGYKPEFSLGSTTPGVYSLRLYNGDTELASGAYPATIAAGQVVAEIRRRG